MRGHGELSCSGVYNLVCSGRIERKETLLLSVIRSKRIFHAGSLKEKAKGGIKKNFSEPRR